MLMIVEILLNEKLICVPKVVQSQKPIFVKSQKMTVVAIGESKNFKLVLEKLNYVDAFSNSAI